MSRSRCTMLTNHPTFRFDSSLQKRMKQWKKLPMSTTLWTNSKNCPKIWEALCKSRTVMYNKFCYLCFLSCNLKICPQNHFSFSIRVEQYELEYWFSKKFNLKTSQKTGTYPFCSRRKVPKHFTINYRITNFTKLAEFGRRLNLIGLCIMSEEKFT